LPIKVMAGVTDVARPPTRIYSGKPKSTYAKLATRI